MIFAFGLVISGMTNPSVVIGFLDILGNWNFSLVFVMVGAISFNFIVFKLLVKKKPYCAPTHFLPTNTTVDKKLVIGSAMFGIGWGIAGICPGPGIVNLVTNDSSAFLFIISLLGGMLLFKATEKFLN
ncbi:MAG: putative membrane protein YedE/YeeE [Bacteriovoracaceae bacterium]|jgi:uncharacterized membrane protein YedE/YeeE